MLTLLFFWLLEVPRRAKGAGYFSDSCTRHVLPAYASVLCNVFRDVFLTSPPLKGPTKWGTGHAIDSWIKNVATFTVISLKSIKLSRVPLCIFYESLDSHQIHFEHRAIELNSRRQKWLFWQLVDKVGIEVEQIFKLSSFWCDRYYRISMCPKTWTRW